MGFKLRARCAAFGIGLWFRNMIRVDDGDDLDHLSWPFCQFILRRIGRE